MKLLLKLSVLLLLFSCAKIPVQSVTLTEAIQTEGARMHNMNLALLNKMFAAKQAEIDLYLNEEYTPEMLKTFVMKTAAVYPGVDFKGEFPDLAGAVMKRVIARRDSLITALQSEKETIVAKLNADFRQYDLAVSEIKNLLQSAAKVEKERKAIYDSALQLSKNRIDLNGLETTLDKFIRQGGGVGEGIATLKEEINKLLNSK